MANSSIVDLILLVIVMTLSLGMFSLQLENRDKAVFRYVISSLVLAGFAVGLYFLESALDVAFSETIDSSLVKNIGDLVLVLVCILSVLVYKKCNWKSIAFVGAASYAMTITIVNFYSLLTVPFFGPNALISITTGTGSTFLRIGAFALSFVGVFAAIWFAFLRGYIKKNYSFAKYSVSKAGFVLMIIIFIINIFTGDDQVETLKYALGLAGKILTCLLVLYTLFGQFNYFSLKFENAQLQNVMERQKRQYEVAKRNMDQINIKAHDLKHVLETLDPKSDISREYAEQLKVITEEYQNEYHTGNKALDVALGDKCRNFDNLGIEFSVIADGASLSFMKDVDVFVLFSNILSNAKEAVTSIENPKGRIISLYIRKDSHLVSIHCENTFSVQPVIHNGQVLTSKKDKMNHGFGLKSIEAIVHQYQGNFKISTSKNIFSLDILFLESFSSIKGENQTI